jgi:hypothetical protein
MRSRVLLGIGLLTCLGACTDGVRSGGPAVAHVHEVPRPAEAPIAITPAADDAGAIGWSSVPRPPPRAATRANAEALVLHRKGDFEAALAGYDGALAIDPSHPWARYNRACALARLARVDEAAVAVRQLLLEDLPQFRRRFLHDEDLETLRDAPAGAELRVLLARIEEAYGDALDRGTPAFVYRERSGWIGETARSARTPYTDLRVGVYDHEQRRFVPMTPTVEHAYSGLLDRAERRAIVAAGELMMKDMWEVQPHAATATVFALDDFGDTRLAATDVSTPDDVSYGFELWLGPDDTLYGAQYNIGYAPQTDYFRWTPAGKTKLGWTHEDTARLEPPQEIPMTGASLHVVELAQSRSPGTAARLRGNRVSCEGVTGSVTLAKGHHDLARIHASADPLIFVVASNTIRFSLDGGEDHTPHTRERHVVDLVDMHTLTATRLASAPGYAHVAWAPDGTLFLDTPTGVVRYAPRSTEAEADVMPGIRFGTPPFPEEGGV